MTVLDLLLDAASGGSEESLHPRGASGSGRGGQFIAKGSSGGPVAAVQKRLGMTQTGHFQFDTEAAVRAFQQQHGLKVDGVVGAQTAQALLGNRNARVVKPGSLSSADAAALGVKAASAPTPKKAAAPAPKKSAAPAKPPKVKVRVSHAKAKAPVRTLGGVAV